MDFTRTSRFISLILRHKPEEIGITLDEHGWADVQVLLEGVNKTHPLTMDILKEIVRTDKKGRYYFNEDHTLIRANQGHSIPVDVELKETTPPEILYHGTGEKFTASIDKIGLIPKSRLYVHLSADRETAVNVGSRHGKPIIYEVHAGKMNSGVIPFSICKAAWRSFWQRKANDKRPGNENVFRGILRRNYERGTIFEISRRGDPYYRRCNRGRRGAARHRRHRYDGL